MVPKGFPFPRNGGHSFPTIFKSNLSSYPDASSLQKGFQTLSIEFGELIGKTCSLLQIIAKFADLNKLACRCVTTFKTGGKKNPEIPGKNPEIGGKNPEIGGLLFACFLLLVKINLISRMETKITRLSFPIVFVPKRCLRDFKVGLGPVQPSKLAFNSQVTCQCP